MQILAQQERHGGQIELYDDLQEDCKVVGKRLLRSWTLDSSEEFSEANPELLESPWKEMELSVKVASVKGVCKCLGAFEDAGQGDIVILMEYVPGGDLHDLVGRCPTEPGLEREAKAWPVILSLLRAVRSLHHFGVAHGDISLENALLGQDGEVRLVDFAAAVTESTVLGSRGKPSYQAPEMHQTTRAYDPRAADLFACGVFAYCLALADYPWRCTRPRQCSAFDFFMARGLSAFLAQRRVRFNDAKGPPVETVLSPKLQHLLKILLDPTPEKRYQVWQELWEEPPTSLKVDLPENPSAEDHTHLLPLKVK